MNNELLTKIDNAAQELLNTGGEKHFVSFTTLTKPTQELNYYRKDYYDVPVFVISCNHSLHEVGTYDSLKEVRDNYKLSNILIDYMYDKDYSISVNQAHEVLTERYKDIIPAEMKHMDIYLVDVYTDKGPMYGLMLAPAYHGYNKTVAETNELIKEYKEIFA